VKKEVSPLVIGIVLGVVVIAVVIIGYRTLSTSYKPVTTGSEKDMERVKQGEALYTPPAGVPGIRTTPPAAGGGGTPGGYNLTPPP
jgi:hypothetical protein